MSKKTDKEVHNLNKLHSTGSRGRIPSKSLFEDGTYDILEFHDTFIEIGDPTEYKAAIELVGSWQEWERLKRDWLGFQNHITLWKEELDIKLKSEAIERINKLAQTEHYQANKWVAEEGYSKQGKAGRPSKKEKKKAAEELARAAAETKEERERVLKLVNQGK
jgi:hypothetical protein